MSRTLPFAWQEDEDESKADHESAQQLAALHACGQSSSSHESTKSVHAATSYLQRLNNRRRSQAAATSKKEEMLVERSSRPTSLRSRQSVSWKPGLPPASTSPPYPSLPGLQHETAAHLIWATDRPCPRVQLSASSPDVVDGDVWVCGVAVH